MDYLLGSFQEHSVIWILISAGLGGLIGALIKFSFEQILGPTYKSATAAKATIRKYTYPILRAAYTLDRRLDNLIKFVDKKWFDDPTDDYYRLSTLYLLGCYFGWCKILEDEAFLEFERSNRKARTFSTRFNTVFKGFTGFYYFEDLPDVQKSSVEAATIPRLVLTAIGELMIKKSEGAARLGVLNFVEFVQRYHSPEFKKWFSYLENLLSNLERSNDNLRFNRLIIIATNLRIFVSFLDPLRRQTSFHEILHLRDLHSTVENRLRDEILVSGYAHLIKDEGTENDKEKVSGTISADA